MSVDLSDSDTLIASLKREVNPPGTDLFPAADDEEWQGQLQDSFWEAKVYGFFEGFTEANGFISPMTGTVDMTRDNQQLIVLFAGARVVRSELKNTPTKFRAEAGPVNFEVDNSASLLVAILRDIRTKIDLAMAAIGTINSTTVAYVDSLTYREGSLASGATFVARGGGGGHAPGNSGYYGNGYW